MKRFFKLIIVGGMLFQSCEKKEVIQLDMDITLDKTTFNVGEEVVFYITGNPDQLSFYSGEEGHRYEYRNRTVAESESITLTFATNRRYGSDAQQPNSLRLLASQSFSGNYTETGIVPGEWIDVTSAFTLSPPQSGNETYQSSGTVDLTELADQGLTIDPNKLLYFAFKYTATTGFTQPRWWINSFDIQTITPDGQVLPITNLQGGEWVSIGFNSSPVSWILNNDGLRFQGGNAALGSNLVYAVSKGFNLNAVSPDISIPLKNMSTRIEEFSHTYTKPGRYRVVFIGANTTVYGHSQFLKEFNIEIVQP